MTEVKSLTNLQLEILQTFSYDINEDQLLEIRQILIDYFADKITQGMDDLFEENNWGDEKLEEWKDEHLRTPYTNE